MTVPSPQIVEQLVVAAHAVHEPSTQVPFWVDGPVQVGPEQPSHTRTCGRVHDEGQPRLSAFSQVVQAKGFASKQSMTCVVGPVHEPMQPSHVRDWVSVPAPHLVEQKVVLDQGLHDLAMPREHSNDCVLLPGHVPTQPSHVRVCGSVPTPQSVEHTPASTQADHATAGPALHDAFWVLAPGQLPQQPSHLRV